MKKLMVIITSLVAINISASIFPSSWTKAKHFNLRIADDIELQAVHIQNKGGKPVLLLHGYMATMHTFMDLADLLHKNGYDVYSANWNVDDRNIDESTTTVVSIVDYIKKKTQKDVLIIGHSLGSVVSKLTVYGVDTDSNRNAYINDEKLKWAQENIRGLVSISGPNGQNNDDTDSASFFDKFPQSILDMMGTDLSRVINDKEVYKESMKVMAMSNILRNLRILPVKDAFSGLFSFSNFGFFDNSLSRFFLYGSQSPSPELALQIKVFTDEMRMGSLNGELDYRKIFSSIRPSVPVFYIGGSSDKFAPSETIINEAKAHKMPYLIFEKSGHLDTMIGRNLKKLVPAIINFDKD